MNKVIQQHPGNQYRNGGNLRHTTVFFCFFYIRDKRTGTAYIAGRVVVVVVEIGVVVVTGSSTTTTPTIGMQLIVVVRVVVYGGI